MKGDYILTFNATEYEPGDVVVFEDPINKGEFMVKRIVAVGSDEVQLVGGALHLNGNYVSEPYVKKPLYFNSEAQTVPSGCCFVLGDNREVSEDSSSEAWRAGTWDCSPCIDMDTIVGKVSRIYLPLDRAGRVKSFSPRSYRMPQQQP